MWKPGCELRADGRWIALGQDSRGQIYRTWTSEKSGLQGRNIPAAAPVHWDAVQKLSTVAPFHVAKVTGKLGAVTVRCGRPVAGSVNL